MDYTKMGKVQLKIIVLANDHDEAINQASNIINNQKQYVRKHKNELDHDRVSYNKMMNEQFQKFVQQTSKNTSSAGEGSSNSAQVATSFDVYS